MDNRQYWGMRTGTDWDTALLLEELKAGRLRQGWGGDDDQDLRLVHQTLERGAELSKTQKDVLRHLKMLSTVEGGIKKGDYIVVPNLPCYGHFCIVEVIGDYYFHMLDLPDGEKDYGHILPVRIITPEGVNKRNEKVESDIRKTLCARSRLWNISTYSQSIEMIIAAAEEKEDLTVATTQEAQTMTLLDSALAPLKDQLLKNLDEVFRKRFYAAELEKPVLDAFKILYPNAEVQHKGGRNEKGCDILIKIPNYFERDASWIIPVQVKNHDADTETSADEVLGQLKAANAAYGDQGSIIALVVVTTAKKMSEGFLDKAEKLSDEIKVPIKAVCGKDFIRLLAEALLRTSHIVMD